MNATFSSDPDIPLSALRELLAAEDHITLDRALQRVEWAIRHGAFVTLPPVMLRPDYAAGTAAEMAATIERVIGSVPATDPAPVPAEPAETPAATDCDDAPVSVGPILAVQPLPETPEDRKRENAVAAHVAGLRATSLFDAQADADLVRWTLDGRAPTEICDQLGCGTQDLKARWLQLQVPGVTVVAGRRDVDGCQLLLEMLDRRAEMEAAA